MRITINTETDLRMLQGKFVLQLDTDTPDRTLMEYNWEFVKEKRLKIVCGKGFFDLYGNVREYKTFDKFKKIFNNYLFPHMEKEGKLDGGRFHRRLSNKERDFVLEKLKDCNF